MEQEYPQPIQLTQEQYATLAKAYINKVYTWMAVSMLVTAGMAIYAMGSDKMLTWSFNNMLWLALGTLGIILIMAFFRNALTAGALTVLFITFSALEGVLLGPVLSVYTTQSLGLTFACTAGMFGAMALYGAVTKRNLSGMGRTLMMLLFGLIIAGIANIFFGSNTADLIISGAGVIIFALYTAYDTQRLLAEGAWLTDEDQRTKGAIMGAVNLYLNFLNLFLYLLRFLGDRE
ncbi:MAG: Bax inhibitor-1/YccA family protein [Akkermansia sp.]|nr:Bax inhibitor-1/YccA family protein [Akkermansia sp.]